MSRIYNTDSTTIDLDKVVAVYLGKPGYFFPIVYLDGGSELKFDRMYVEEIKKAWEEYMKDKEPEPTIEELKIKLVEKDCEIQILKAYMDGILRSVRR